jgi:hypothetical protein
MLLLYRDTQRLPYPYEVLLPDHVGNLRRAYPCSKRLRAA